MRNLIVVTPEDLRDLISVAVRTELEGFKPQTSEPQATEFLTRKQTAERLQISLVTLHQWTKSGILKGYRISGRIRFKSSEIESALQAMRTF